MASTWYKKTAPSAVATPDAPYVAIFNSDGTEGTTLNSWYGKLSNGSVVALTFSDEQAQDAVGNILTDTASIDFTYNDAAGLITADVKAGATAILDVATTAVKGLQSANDKLKENNIWFDVTTDFGADNLDKTGATDNTTKINNILSAVPAGSILYWPAGTYDTNGGHSITKTLIFVGGGRSSTVINATHATNTIFSLTSGGAGTGFERLRISCDNSSLRTAGFAVDLTTAANSYLQQVDILFQWSGVRSGGSLQFFWDMNIREMGANAANGQCILITGSGDRYANRITTDNPSDPTGFAAIRLTQCASFVLSDCNLINGTNAIDIVPAAGLVVASVLAVNCFFDSSVIGCNIVPASPTATAQRIRFINCWFSTCTTAGVKLGNAGTHPTANINSVDFIGCDFYQNPVGIDAVNVAEWSVRASRVAGNTTAGIRIVQGDQAATHGFSITDNFIGNGAGFGANAIGITIAAGTYNRYQILDNRGLESNTTPGITDNGVVGPTGQKNVTNNMGTLILGAQVPLSSGGAALINARNAITSGTTETFLMTFRIPANSVAVQQTFKLTLYGQSSSTGTLITNIRAGAAGTIAGDTLISAVVASAASVANGYHLITGLVTVIALGPTATVAAAHTQFHATTFLQKTAAAEASANAPTTAAWFITISASISTGTWAVKHAVLEAV